MALNEQDYFEILYHLQEEVAGNEPQLANNFLEISNNIIEEYEDPRKILIHSLERLIELLEQESSNTYENVLTNLNNFVETEEGQKIDGIHVELSPKQKKLYQQDYIDLSEMKSQETMISELNEIIEEIRSNK
ncbi:hypothetical protein CK503_11200 [Aliifodinibius salipaludis]|uniref:Uncharacterized protein n=1 Tax=Fodinibius salipaludis TaxID=2032627 RepID=A0A2A2G971_9BACT|nr:hypothetical protein [Aliifodinibius salipaludis]PAU93710.1 hypothetical protein CK503_11200 [Aliifodinibius salipaludis]